MTTLSNVKKLSVIAAGATCLSLGAMNPAQALNLVSNGGFETGDFSGWTQSGNTGFTGVDSASANSGNFGAFFGPIGTPGFLSQTLATVAGQTYNLSYFLKSDGGKPNSFAVSAGSEVLSTFTNLAFPFTSSPAENTFSFIAQAPSTVLKFAFQQDPAYLRLDDVSVTSTSTAIPTPALLPGLIGLGFGVLRKRKAAAMAGAAES
ncbi:PTPA-CTERM sorting domain-containing protein [Phormidesmis priestleyi ULC007]|uniref:PTPA-CTERM sorting domain-containing protein n=1 Tax=Phormidesmis priestleyi ULC007 TaxID=1920490 RepID=A0A2T1DLF3_9CYAN|nr:PTPA-CTERM sorting domain-containing protein [Phormidesmis priestleyi]PSB21285.1 PTPA-CTERM sorting domain-containing protein [Phormidesmis priestleyi ULC007]PZO50656.1 MAG: PTPA-CTERM sorting domain-containing protein [Phormidesmis priestleyi]